MPNRSEAPTLLQHLLHKLQDLRPLALAARQRAGDRREGQHAARLHSTDARTSRGGVSRAAAAGRLSATARPHSRTMEAAGRESSMRGPLRPSPCRLCTYLAERAAAGALLLPSMLRDRQGPHLSQILVAALLAPVDAAAAAARRCLAPLAATGQRLVHQLACAVVLQHVGCAAWPPGGARRGMVCASASHASCTPAGQTDTRRDARHCAAGRRRRSALCPCRWHAPCPPRRPPRSRSRCRRSTPRPRPRSRCQTRCGGGSAAGRRQAAMHALGR